MELDVKDQFKQLEQDSFEKTTERLAQRPYAKMPTFLELVQDHPTLYTRALTAWLPHDLCTVIAHDLIQMPIRQKALAYADTLYKQPVSKFTFNPHTPDSVAFCAKDNPCVTNISKRKPYYFNIDKSLVCKLLFNPHIPDELLILCKRNIIRTNIKAPDAQTNIPCEDLHNIYHTEIDKKNPHTLYYIGSSSYLDKGIKCINMETQEQKTLFNKHYQITTFTLAHDGHKVLVSGNDTNYVCTNLYDIKTEQLIYTLDKALRETQSIAQSIHLPYNICLSHKNDNMITLFDTRTNQKQYIKTTYSRSCSFHTFSDYDPYTLISATEIMSLYDIRNTQKPFHSIPLDYPCQDIAFDPHHDRMALTGGWWQYHALRTTHRHSTTTGSANTQTRFIYKK